MYLPILQIIIAVTHLKKNRLVSDVLEILSSFGSSNIILALPSNPTETVVPVGDPAVKKFARHVKSHSSHLKKMFF